MSSETRAQPQSRPLIPEYRDPDTLLEHRRLIATSLGLEDQRYSSELPKEALVRLYTIILDEEPDHSIPHYEIRAALAEELELGDADYLRESETSFRKDAVLAITDHLRGYTQDALEPYWSA